MARRVDEFPVAPSQSAYPWDDYLDGGVWELVEDEDFKGKPATFRSNAIAQAKKRGGKVRTRRIKDANGVGKLYIQFYRE